MSKACVSPPTNECNDSVLSNKVSSTPSNPPAASSTVSENNISIFMVQPQYTNVIMISDIGLYYTR